MDTMTKGVSTIGARRQHVKFSQELLPHFTFSNTKIFLELLATERGAKAIQDIWKMAALNKESEVYPKHELCEPYGLSMNLYVRGETQIFIVGLPEPAASGEAYFTAMVGKKIQKGIRRKTRWEARYFSLQKGEQEPELLEWSYERVGGLSSEVYEGRPTPTEEAFLSLLLAMEQ